MTNTFRVTNEMDEAFQVLPGETVAVHGDVAEGTVEIESVAPVKKPPDEPCECPPGLREIGVYEITDDHPHSQHCNRCGGYIE